MRDNYSVRDASTVSEPLVQYDCTVKT